MARKPTHPGEVLREEFMPDYGLTVAGIAERLGVSRQSVNELVRERRALSTEMAVRLTACSEPRRNTGSTYSAASICGSRSISTMTNSKPSNN